MPSTSTAVLRRRYAMSGSEIGYAGTRWWEGREEAKLGREPGTSTHYCASLLSYAACCTETA
eukprot:975085-Rhodomonas_salina.1